MMDLSALETMCVGTSLAVSSLFYYLYRRQRLTVTRIQAAHRLHADSDPKKLLGSTKELPYVVLEGTVEAMSTPLHSKNQPHLQAVIQRQCVIEHRLLWNSFTQNWSECERMLHESVNSVPFQLYLLGGSENPVLVSDPLNASGLILETVHEKFHAPSPGFGELVWHYMSGEKPTGLLEKEEILAVGATLTGLGRLTLDSNGVLTLSPPHDGSEYFLSLEGYEGILEQQKNVATFWKGAALVCGAVGTALLCIFLYRAYRRRKEEQTGDRRLIEEKRTISQEEQSSEEGGSTPERVCVICLSQPRECVILPCGHLCCCFTCYQALPTSSCPICRCHIQRVVPFY
ncbi:mitochondrial ubiquitin ligase activator of nfkb 1-A [Bombina bombina]|uniref:mitochondrial ubiquitin ligase activator of nfkb 1-A n=1 Tax=Bombina bombina TaxID=8345 RepID=UPI00235AFF77|nr:mitochondrial ubiquitin ligase activator of nfkb 1-A [Bombina bombina]